MSIEQIKRIHKKNYFVNLFISLRLKIGFRFRQYKNTAILSIEINIII